MEQIDSPKERRVRVDGPTLEARAANYPVELREPFLWLGSFYRTKCYADPDTFANHCRELDIHVPKDDWSKIFKGLMLQEENGSVRGKPVMKVKELTAVIKTLRDHETAREETGHIAYVLTERGQSIIDLVDDTMTPGRINRFGLVSGHTGTEKTETFKHILKTHPFGDYLLVNSPENGSRGQLLTDVAEQCGCHRSLGADRKLSTVLKFLNRDRCLILENLQWLYREDLEDQQPAFNFVQKFQEQTGCGVIGSITPVFKDKILAKLTSGFFEQFIGRAGGVKRILSLPKYTPVEDVLKIAEAHNLQNAQASLDYLVEISREPGLIRVLFEALQRGKMLAESDKQKFTIKHVKAVRGDD